MTKFAKLYETEKYGQILVKIDRGGKRSEPEVRFYVQPEDLGVCSLAAQYDDNDDGWDKAEKFFESVDEEAAVQYVKHVFDALAFEED